MLNNGCPDYRGNCYTHALRMKYHPVTGEQFDSDHYYCQPGALLNGDPLSNSRIYTIGDHRLACDDFLLDAEQLGWTALKIDENQLSGYLDNDYHILAFFYTNRPGIWSDGDYHWYRLDVNENLLAPDQKPSQNIDALTWSNRIGCDGEIISEIPFDEVIPDGESLGRGYEFLTFVAYKETNENTEGEAKHDE